MNGLSNTNSPHLYLEIGQNSLHALNGDEGLDLTLERLENGRLSSACKERLTNTLRGFLKRKGWHSRMRAYCAIGARGVSLRRLALPASGKEEIQRLVRLQIEAEFPLPPDELAWGWSAVGPTHNNGQPARQELVVAALKKEMVEEYAEVLAACGVNPVFTLAALARSSAVPNPPGAFALLDIGRNRSELLTFDNGAPASVRMLPWGGENLTRAIAERLGVSRDEAEQLKIKLDQQAGGGTESGQAVQSAITPTFDTLAASLKEHWKGQKIYLTGRSARQKDFAQRLSVCLGGGLDCERIDLPAGPGRSAAVLGLKRSSEFNGAAQLLAIRLKETNGAESPAGRAPGKLAVIAALLLVGVCAYPYLEALVMKPFLAKRLAAVKADKGRLAVIDRELDFLQFLKRSQPPYLDTVYLLARSAAPGMKIDSLAMNRRGEIALRGSMQNAQQITDFRSKLIESGLFANVAVEEQSPTPDRQKVIMRMSAQWKPVAERESLSFEPSAKEIEQFKANKDAKPGAAGGPAGMPAGMSLPPGMVLPPGVTLPPGFQMNN